MNFRLGFISRLFAKRAGADAFGNKYYYRRLRNGYEKRWVVYRGIVEPSKIPALWHSWLHHITNHIPTPEEIQGHEWQQSHVPNLTGTVHAHKPAHVTGLTQAMDAYKPWDPSVKPSHDLLRTGK
ncbi:MAG: NADH:ubiquinone oxidoreductase subunit NDUFA12 [Alphaproteobacteria bacterium]|nr:NADH:ubiquinone oxidoreductase subunit NDUFA12 [Alphaproteobacteria bacterium]